MPLSTMALEHRFDSVGEEADHAEDVAVPVW